MVKYDAENDSYLAGATFRIAKIEDGSHYLDRVTDTNGRISISDLEPGVYSVKEIAAPSGYVLNDTEYHVELFPGKDSTLVVNNEKKPNLKIVKTDAVTGAPLSGVTFTVNKADSSTLTLSRPTPTARLCSHPLTPVCMWCAKPACRMVICWT